jgi:hypothetical protein
MSFTARSRPQSSGGVPHRHGGHVVVLRRPSLAALPGSVFDAVNYLAHFGMAVGLHDLNESLRAELGPLLIDRIEYAVRAEHE